MGQLWKRTWREKPRHRRGSIQRAYRVKIDKNKWSNTPRAIICRTLNYKDKVKILRKAKKDFYKLEILPSHLDYRKELLRVENNGVYFQYRSIVVKRKYNIGSVSWNVLDTF